jgi:serine/threonine-protein kinase
MCLLYHVGAPKRVMLRIMPETGDPALIGRRIAGKFLVERFLGGGAMGAVYRAKDTTLDRNVALKVMHSQVAVDPSFVSRFHREARAASRLDHPNSMRVIEFGSEQDGLLYIAMEYLEGRDLYKVIHEDWPLSNERLSDIMMKALAAITMAHEMGVIHRDLKPENIMVLDRKDDEGKDIVKVCDFGIAKITESDGSSSDGPARTAGAKLTTAGVVVGTPEYMSPEQARGEKLDARSDLYSMGIILYFTRWASSSTSSSRGGRRSSRTPRSRSC